MFLEYLKLNVEKRFVGVREDVGLNSFINTKRFLIEREPIPHVVVDNFFTESAYKKLSAYFTRCLNRGISERRDRDRFHPFLDHKGTFAYDGYVHSLQYGENEISDLFFSVEWNLLFSKILSQQTDWCVTTELHYHMPKNRTGYIHNDYVSKSFVSTNRLSNGIITGETRTSGGNAGQVFSSMRIIALIYYLNNDFWERGDGGETGLYLSDTKESLPTKLIEPINNRLLAFQISPRSFHAFQQNYKPRSSVVQWFHVDPQWCQKKYGFVQ